MRYLLFLILLLVPRAAAAQHFSSSNLQLLYGGGFDDWYYGNTTADGTLTTLTLEHFTAFSVGDVFFFTDLTSGEFVGFDKQATGQEHRIYAELAVRLSGPRLLGGRPLQGFVRDLYVAGQINRDGNGFAAHLVGGGVDLALPGFAVASVNVYYRDDTFNAGTYQVTAVWDVPYRLGVLAGAFVGFLDVYGTDNDGADVHTQPQLVVTIPNTPFQVGTELYVHTNDPVTTVAPQALVKWVF